MSVCVDNIGTVVDVVRVVLVNCDDCASMSICVELMGSCKSMSEVDGIVLEIECVDETILD